MRVYTETITFDGGGAKTIALAATRQGMQRIFAEPSSANTHVAYVGDVALDIGSSTDDHVIKQLAKPTAADAPLDSWEVFDTSGGNGIQLSQYTFDGESGESVVLTMHEH